MIDVLDLMLISINIILNIVLIIIFFKCYKLFKNEEG